MAKLDHIFRNNEQWRQSMLEEDPLFFEKISEQQSPEILWIGCSDSRVPANQIMGLPPGRVFVHRNVANLVVHSDLNCLSVIQYAVEVLFVNHIVVCGHYDCGGIATALDERDHGLIDNWLRHAKDVYRLHEHELSKLSSSDQNRRMTELNIMEQVNNLSATTVLSKARHEGRTITLHGWIYSVADGTLKELCAIE